MLYVTTVIKGGERKPYAIAWYLKDEVPPDDATLTARILTDVEQKYPKHLDALKKAIEKKGIRGEVCSAYTYIEF